MPFDRPLLSRLEFRRTCLFWMLQAMLCGHATAQDLKSDIERIGTRDINRSERTVATLSLESEVNIGRALAREFEQRVQLHSDLEVQALVDRVGQTLARNSDVRVPVVTKVIASDEQNVIALPGGTIYVTTGLIGAASTEAELAAALAQGIAHVAARHGMEGGGRTHLLTFPPISPASFHVFSRKQVSEADFLGILYLYKAGYEPQAANRMLQTLEVQSAPVSERLVSPGVSLFSPGINSYMPERDIKTKTSQPGSHPTVADRVKALERHIALLPARDENKVTSSEFERVRREMSR